VGSEGFSRFPSRHSLVGSDGFVPKSIVPTVTFGNVTKCHTFSNLWYKATFTFYVWIWLATTLIMVHGDWFANQERTNHFYVSKNLGSYVGEPVFERCILMTSWDVMFYVLFKFLVTVWRPYPLLSHAVLLVSSVHVWFRSLSFQRVGL